MACHTPPIKLIGTTESIHNPEEKARALADSFFPKPPEADLTEIEGYEYPEPL